MKISKKQKYKNGKHKFQKKNKKKKMKAALLQNEKNIDEVVKSKDKGMKQDCKGRNFTVSIALPGSIMHNAQSPQLQTYLAGQIARACVIFQVDEIIIYDDACGKTPKAGGGRFSGMGNIDEKLVRLLEYMECPQYLRKSLIPFHRDLQNVGVLNPLDSPHHMRREDWTPFREGVVLNRNSNTSNGSLVNCGLYNPVVVDQQVDHGQRVTVRLLDDDDKMNHRGIVVPPETPRVEKGIYWGYTVRSVGSLSLAISQCPYAEKYDLTIGTSERGDSVDDFHLPSFKHLLIVFGGLPGLEFGLANDQSLSDIDNPRLLFDHYLNTCLAQGSRTIRTEEAILITMSSLRAKIQSHL